MNILPSGEIVQPRPRLRVRTLRRLAPLSLLALDGILIYLSFALAYWVRYSLKLGPRIHDDISFHAYLPVALMLLGIMMPVLLAKGAYRFRLSTEIVDQFGTIFSASTIAIAAIVVVTAMLHKFQYSRGLIVYLWVLVIVLVSAGRAAYRSAQAFLHRRGWGVRRLVVVGATDVGKMVMQSVMSRRDLGYQLVGFVERRGASQVRNFGRFQALGTVADIPGLIEQRLVDDIIVALPASAHEEVWPILSLCERHGVGLKIVPDLFEMSLGRVQVDDIAGIPLLDVQERPTRPLARLAKRAMDVVVSVVLLVASLPLLALLAVAIMLESPGSPFLLQDRVGLGGRGFCCLKLRTMRRGAAQQQPALRSVNEASGPIFKIRNDPRLTHVGRVIRRWSLDELPQLWNVLIGDMSLVGPRPPLPGEVAEYEPGQRRRLEVKPGMTGIWQVSGRSDLHFEEMVMMDIYYVENWSLTLDITILMRTVVAVLTHQGAY